MRSGFRARSATTATTLDFSFSGLKTAVMNYVRKHPDVVVGRRGGIFQTAVVDVLVNKSRRAAEQVGAKGIVLGGGVAANSLLREEMLGAVPPRRSTRFPAEPGDVHRQRGDDRCDRLVSVGERRPDSLDIGAFPNLGLPLLDA